MTRKTLPPSLAENSETSACAHPVKMVRCNLLEKGEWIKNLKLSRMM